MLVWVVGHSLVFWVHSWDTESLNTLLRLDHLPPISPAQSVKNALGLADTSPV